MVVRVNARPPSRCDASVAITSLAFMFDEVPEPVWNVSTGNCASCRPSATSLAAAAMASARSDSTTPELSVHLAAARLDPSQGPDVCRLQPAARYREVLHRPLGLRPPQGVRGDPDLTHRVALDPVRSIALTVERIHDHILPAPAAHSV